MTPEANTALRVFFQMRDLAHDDEPETLFEGLARIVAWAELQRSKPTKEHDRLFDGPVIENTSLFMGLLPALGTIDGTFFNLAKRVMAATLVTHDPPRKAYLRIAAHMLVTNPPQTRAPRLARNVCIVLAVATSQRLGCAPTSSSADVARKSSSGCGRLVSRAGELGAQMLTYEAVEEVWKGRVKTLTNAGFGEEVASGIFEEFTQ